MVRSRSYALAAAALALLASIGCQHHRRCCPCQCQCPAQAAAPTVAPAPPPALPSPPRTALKPVPVDAPVSTAIVE
jgi:hypothetical protein